MVSITALKSNPLGDAQVCVTGINPYPLEYSTSICKKYYR